MPAPFSPPPVSAVPPSAGFKSPFDLARVLDLFQAELLVRHFLELWPMAPLVDGQVLYAETQTAFLPPPPLPS